MKKIFFMRFIYRDSSVTFVKKNFILFSLVLFLSVGILVYRYCMPTPQVRPLILSISSYPILPDEIEFLRKVRPYGILIFGRRPHLTESKSFISQLKKELNRPDLLFFVDHEGGTVNRFYRQDPKRFPSARYFGKKAEKDIEKAKKEIYENALEAGKEIKNIGVDVVLGPAAEICLKENFLKTRCHSKDPTITAEMAESFARGMSAAGLEVGYKHLPGIGGAEQDMHDYVVIVNRTLEELRTQEAVAMQYAKNWKYAMTSHAIYPALDAENISTYSPKVNQFIREELGFEGFIITDALNMKGSELEQLGYGERIQKALEAGADIVVPAFWNLTSEEKWKEVQKISPQEIEKFNKKLREKNSK